MPAPFCCSGSAGCGRFAPSTVGGIIACGEISEDVPLANIRAMYEAFMEYRH